MITQHGGWDNVIAEFEVSVLESVVDSNNCIFVE